MAPWGDDAHAGTFEQPFATLTRARDAVRPLIAVGLTQPVTVLIRGGTYRITNPIVFGLEDSGSEPHSITYAAYPLEAPAFSGGRRIEGWTPDAGGTWSAILPEVAAGLWSFRELFADGVRRPRARHPNTGFVRVANVEPGERMRFTFYEGDLPEQTDLTGAELVFLHDWDISRIAIDAVDYTQNVLATSDPIGAAAPIFAVDFFEAHPRYYVENDIALLDEPGEWFLNEQTGKLTYFPMPAEDVNSAELIAPVAGELLVLRGDFESEQFISNVHFVGLSFEHCAWDLPPGGYAAYQAGFYEWRDTSTPYEFPAAITFEQADACRFDDGRIAHVGGWGIMFGRACRNCALVGTAVSDIAGNGVLVGEDQYRNVPGGQWWLLRPDQAATGNAVRNNLIEHCGEVFHGCVGVWAGLANTTDISHNLIRHAPQTGVSVGGMWNDTPTPCFQNSVSRNHIHDVMLMLSDGAGIYTLGLQPGTVFGENLIHSIPPNAGSAESNGVFCDEGSTSLLIDGNAIFSVKRSPLRFHRAGVNVVSNNTLLLSHASVPPVRYNVTDPADIVMTNNEIATPSAPVDCEHAVYGVTPLAGLEPEYRERLIGPPTNDGCASCAGVPYSGLSLDACGVCGGTGISCGIPTVSQWGMLVLFLLLQIAAIVVFTSLRRRNHHRFTDARHHEGNVAVARHRQKRQ